MKNVLKIAKSHLTLVILVATLAHGACIQKPRNVSLQADESDRRMAASPTKSPSEAQVAVAINILREALKTQDLREYNGKIERAVALLAAKKKETGPGNYEILCGDGKLESIKYSDHCSPTVHEMCYRGNIDEAKIGLEADGLYYFADDSSIETVRKDRTRLMLSVRVGDAEEIEEVEVAPCKS